MSKSISFKGTILFMANSTSRKNTMMKYKNPVFKDGFEDNFQGEMMSSFEHLNLTYEEKKNLSRSHRKMLNYFKHLSPFALKDDAQVLIDEINESDADKITIEADHYGAYVCLTALFSGKLSSDKKIEFILEKAPLALFPNTLMKAEPQNSQHKVYFRVSEDCWISPFSSLYNNQRIKYTLAKKSHKKAA